MARNQNMRTKEQQHTGTLQGPVIDIDITDAGEMTDQKTEAERIELWRDAIARHTAEDGTVDVCHADQDYWRALGYKADW